jgi:hypothetical protein
MVARLLAEDEQAINTAAQAAFQLGSATSGLPSGCQAEEET